MEIKKLTVAIDLVGKCGSQWVPSGYHYSSK